AVPPVAREAASLLGVAVALAFAADPYRRLPARELLEALARAALPTPGTRTMLEALRLQCLRPPAPDEARRPYAGAPDPLRAVLLALHALLVRPRSVEEAVVYAVNLGGRASLRGALAGALAGAHRGAAAVPERWTA